MWRKRVRVASECDTEFGNLICEVRAKTISKRHDRRDRR